MSRSPAIVRPRRIRVVRCVLAMVLTSLLASVLAVVAAPAASALPGDPPVTPILPADGAVVPTAPQGIPITFACPRYGDYTFLGQVVTAGSADYRAAVSDSPAVDGRGILSTQIKTASGPTGDPGTCESRLGSNLDTTDLRPQRVPGTYYWQVWRLCSDCAGGVEVGPVRSFTVAVSTTLKLRTPLRVYAGIPTLTRVRVTGDLGWSVSVERRTASGWSTVGRALPGGQGDVAADELAVIATLPRGTQVLRAVARSGSSMVTSPVWTAKVRRAEAWSPGTSAVGAYRDRSHSLRLKVTDRGRVLRGFTANVTATCVDAFNNITVQDRILTLPKAKIAPDGRFVVALQRQGQRAWLEGRLARGRVTGYGSLQAGECSGDLHFTARR